MAAEIVLRENEDPYVLVRAAMGTEAACFPRSDEEDGPEALPRGIRGSECLSTTARTSRTFSSGREKYC
jgi:hypothetical protein